MSTVEERDLPIALGDRQCNSASRARDERNVDVQQDQATCRSS